MAGKILQDSACSSIPAPIAIENIVDVGRVDHGAAVVTESAECELKTDEGAGGGDRFSSCYVAGALAGLGVIELVCIPARVLGARKERTWGAPGIHVHAPGWGRCAVAQQCARWVVNVDRDIAETEAATVLYAGTDHRSGQRSATR